MKTRWPMIAVLVSLLVASPGRAQIEGGTTFNGLGTAVSTQSGTGTSGSTRASVLGALSLQVVTKLLSIVQVVLASSTACGTVPNTPAITLNDGYAFIPNSLTAYSGQMCQALFYKVLAGGENPTASWTGSLNYDVREYYLANVSVPDVASTNNGNSGTLTALSVTTTQAGDYLAAFYANANHGYPMTPPSNMGIAVSMDYGAFSPFTHQSYFSNLMAQSWFYPIGATGNEVALMGSNSTYWIATLVAFKALYPIQIQGIAQPLAQFGTCSPSLEGARQTESNSTAACSSGATATSAGTTHCEIRCNGTDWIQTGL